MTIDVDIQAALLERLDSPPLTGAPDIAYPLVAFTPTPGTAYLDAHAVMRGDVEQFGLAFDSDTIHVGFFQVDTVMPDGAGEAPGLRLAALVADRFAVGTTLVAGANRLKVLAPPSIAAVVKDAPWVRFPVTIPYRLVAG